MPSSLKPQTELQEARANALHKVTNESLWAISAGLDPKPTDSILAIAGSGDQAFALLASGAEIRAIDKDQAQLTYTLLRAEALRRGDKEAFLEGATTLDKEAHTYFDPPRLDTIRDNLARLSINNPEDIFTYVTHSRSRFTKIYLSNCIDDRSKTHPLRALEKLILALHQQGLIYSAQDDIHPERDKENLHRIGLEIDRERTESAYKEGARNNQRGLLEWYPKVYRKIT